MRTTRASAAIDRLNRRSNNANYSMAMSSNGLFSLVTTEAKKLTETNALSVIERTSESADSVYQVPKSQRLCEPMPMDEFVAFVNAYGPQTPKKLSKLDIAFSEQLAKSKTNKT